MPAPSREALIAAMIAYDTVMARTSTPNIREKYEAMEAALLAAAATKGTNEQMLQHAAGR